MTLNEWRDKGRADAENGRPYSPPPLGPIMQKYTEGYDEGSQQ